MVCSAYFPHLNKANCGLRSGRRLVWTYSGALTALVESWKKTFLLAVTGFSSLTLL